MSFIINIKAFGFQFFRPIRVLMRYPLFGDHEN